MSPVADQNLNELSSKLACWVFINRPRFALLVGATCRRFRGFRLPSSEDKSSMVDSLLLSLRWPFALQELVHVIHFN